MGFKAHKQYTIVNVKTNEGIDNGNRANNGEHPYMYATTPSAANHRWTLKHVHGDYYMIVSQQNMALDGGADKPYLWQATHDAHNHHWKFEKIGDDKYILINRHTGKALDGGAPEPYMWEPTPSALNHQWIVRNAAKSGDKREFKADKLYTIVNVKDNRGLDNGNRANNGEHPYMYATTPSAANHQWHIRRVHDDYYTIVSHQGLALDGGADKPYLWQATPDAHNHQWKFVELGNRKYMIVNRHTNKALDGGADTPYMWDQTPSALNHQWIVKKV